MRFWAVWALLRRALSCATRSCVALWRLHLRQGILRLVPIGNRYDTLLEESLGTLPIARGNAHLPCISLTVDSDSLRAASASTIWLRVCSISNTSAVRSSARALCFATAQRVPG